MSLVRLENVSRIYPTSVPIRALAHVDLTIEPSDHVALVGPSGSGKSTLLNVMGLLDRPSGGRVLVDEIDMSSASERVRTRLRARSIGFVFQAFHLIDHRTVLENIKLGMVYGAPTSPRRRRDVGRSLCETVGLGDRLDAFPSQLSAGQQQRVAIARALAASPRLLLCDEPTGNLDSENTEAILDLFDDVRVNQGIAVVIATHDPLVSKRARRVVTVFDGSVG